MIKSTILNIYFSESILKFWQFYFVLQSWNLLEIAFKFFLLVNFPLFLYFFLSFLFYILSLSTHQICRRKLERFLLKVLLMFTFVSSKKYLDLCLHFSLIFYKVYTKIFIIIKLVLVFAIKVIFVGIIFCNFLNSSSKRFLKFFCLINLVISWPRRIYVNWYCDI